MSDALPFSKDRQLHPVTSLCPCGCGVDGKPRKKPWRDGMAPHVHRCPCRRCVGGRQVKKAARRERRVAKDFGGRRNYGSGSHGGVDSLDAVIDIEETANLAVVRGIRRWWESKTVQTKTATLLSRNIRPRALVISWDGRPQLAVFPYEDAVALAEATFGPEAS